MPTPVETPIPHRFLPAQEPAAGQPSARQSATSKSHSADGAPQVGQRRRGLEAVSWPPLSDSHHCNSRRKARCRWKRRLESSPRGRPRSGAPDSTARSELISDDEPWEGFQTRRSRSFSNEIVRAAPRTRSFERTQPNRYPLATLGIAQPNTVGLAWVAVGDNALCRSARRSHPGGPTEVWIAWDQGRRRGRLSGLRDHELPR